MKTRFDDRRKVTGQTPTRFHDLAGIAEILGVTLSHHEDGPPGYYDHDTRTISTRRGMDIGMYRSVLAHELGHAVYNDQPTGNRHFDQRQEDRADRFAVRLLFTDDDFHDAYDWCGPDVPALADELECSQHHVRTHIKRRTP